MSPRAPSRVIVPAPQTFWMDCDSTGGGRPRSGSLDYKPWGQRALRAIERRARLPASVPKLRPVGSISETTFGYGFRHDFVSGDTVANMNATFSARAASQSADPTWAILLGGANDLFGGATEDTVYAAISTWCATARARWPTSRVVVITPKPNLPGGVTTIANLALGARTIANKPAGCDEVWDLWTGWPTTAMRSFQVGMADYPDGHPAVPTDPPSFGWDTADIDPQDIGIWWFALALWRRLRPDYPVRIPGGVFP